MPKEKSPSSPIKMLLRCYQIQFAVGVCVFADENTTSAVYGEIGIQRRFLRPDIANGIVAVDFDCGIDNFNAVVNN